MSPLRHPSLSLSPLTNAHPEPLASCHSPAADPSIHLAAGFRHPKPPLSPKHLPSPSIWSGPFNAEMHPPRRQTGAASSQEPRRVQGLANETHGSVSGWGVCGLRQLPEPKLRWGPRVLRLRKECFTSTTPSLPQIL